MKTNFIFLNINPDGLIEKDCVCRAISLASGKPYEIIDDKLHYTALLLECEKLCVCCYEFLLDCVFEFPRVEASGMTIGEFAEANPEGIFITRVEGHLSAIIDGNIYDIWDCSNEIITDCWEVLD